MKKEQRMALRHGLIVTTATALSFTLLLGCSLLKKKKDPGGDDTSNAPTVTVTGTGAKNEKDILRYGTETKLDNLPGVITKDVTKVKTFPASGQDVATLAKGATCVQLAKFFSTGVLIIFDDPTISDGSKLMGWISPDNVGSPGSVAVTPTAVPTIIKPVAAFDAGVKAVDAGVATADAGGAVPVLVAGQLQVLPTNGKCPVGMALMGPFCRRPCITAAQCPAGTFCTSAAGPKSCSATK